MTGGDSTVKVRGCTVTAGGSRVTVEDSTVT